MSCLTSVMKRPRHFTFVFVASILFCTVGSVYALSYGGPGGAWPKSWSKELEPLRKQASTWYHGRKNKAGQQYTCYNMPFANRKEFESAWPHILKLKSKGVSLTLISGPHWYAPDMIAGATIWPPLESSAGPASVTRIFLMVDGKIVDLNRIRLPADTLIIDERFKD